MEKKYLMLIPLAIPLFFGGKAAVTAIKRKSVIKNEENENKELKKGTLVTGKDSGNRETIEVDEHIEELRDAVIQDERSAGISADPGEIEQPSEEEIKYPDEEEITPPDEEEIKTSSDIKISELPGEDEPGRMTLRGNSDISGNTPEGKQIFTGPKGGKYFYNDAGKKIYLK